MRDLVIADQQRRIALDHAAAALARVAITLEHLQAEALPARCVVPSLPWQLRHGSTCKPPGHAGRGAGQRQPVAAHPTHKPNQDDLANTRQAHDALRRRVHQLNGRLHCCSRPIASPERHPISTRLNPLRRRSAARPRSPKNIERWCLQSNKDEQARETGNCADSLLVRKAISFGWSGQGLDTGRPCSVSW